MLIIFKGQKARQGASGHLALTPKGILYVGVQIREQLPPETAFVQMSVEDELCELYLTPCNETTEGRLAVPRKASSKCCRIHCHNALAWCGIQVKSKVIFPGWVENGRIVGKLPAGAIVKKGATGTPAPQPIEPPRTTREVAKVETPETPEDKQVEPRCCTCPSYKTLVGVRMNGICKQRNETVKADGVYGCHPNAAMKEIAAGKAKWVSTRSTRQRETCPRCGHLVNVTTQGLFPHDTDGVEFRGGHGDRSQRCAEE